MIHFEQELDGLKQKLLTMAGHAENSLANAIKALTDRDEALAAKVKQDDRILDTLEMEIDELAIELLAKAPLASQLRLVTVAMKASVDLERVGDEATTIARRAAALSALPPLKPAPDLARMASLATAMLRDAVGSFVTKNTAQARLIVPRDKEVDALNKQAQQDLTALMLERPDTITRALHLMVISKSLERVADHAKNIAEEVVFLQEGCDIRHGAGSAPPA